MEKDDEEEVDEEEEEEEQEDETEEEALSEEEDEEDETEDEKVEGATPRIATRNNRTQQGKKRRMHSDATISMVHSRSLRKRPRSCVRANATDTVREKRRRMCRIN